MSEKKHTRISLLLYAPVLAIIAVGLSSIVISILVLYSAAFSEEKNRLRELSQSQARLIEAVARFDRQYSTAYVGSSTEATISQIIDAQKNYEGFGETGEFTLARLNGDQIEFILTHRHFDLGNPKPIPFQSGLAEPMRRALSGISGVDVAIDYRGVQVLAAYEPVAELDLGIVAKIDLSEIRKPFIKAGLWLSGVTLILIFTISFVMLRISRPISLSLLDMARQATEANQEKSRFLAAMSHDLRTPLNAIMGFSDMMRMKAFGPLGDRHYEEYANDIHHSGALLVRLIDDVLDISKVEAGKFTLHEEILNIPVIVSSCIHQLDPMIKKSRLEIFNHVPSPIPELKGDERVLFQLLNNLLSNAIKFTPAGGRIDVNVDVDQDNRIIFNVTDTGIGMTEDEITQAIKPFVQIDNTHSHQHKGTGLGLHLCSNFMALLGGSMKIDSAVGEGTTVSLTFPPERTISHSSVGQTH